MYLTEAEAREQLCPFIRHCTNEVGAIHQGASAIYEHQYCQASACKMAWRWQPAWTMNRTDPTPHRGYCGITGVPPT